MQMSLKINTVHASFHTYKGGTSGSIKVVMRMLTDKNRKKSQLTDAMIFLHDI